jgi:chromosome segregation ATPase
MFFKASQLENLNTKNNDLEGEVAKIKNEISEKNQEIETINQKALRLEKNLRDDQLKFQRSTANAKEVNRLEMKKANEVLQGKLEDIKTLTEQVQANQKNYEIKEKIILKQITDFIGQISSLQSTNLENMNALKKAQVVTQESNKKNTALNKEVSDLKSDLTDSKELLKESRVEYEKKITQEKTEWNKLKASLEKELTEKKKVQEDLETTKNRLDKAEAEVNELNKKIKELEETQSPSQ